MIKQVTSVTLHQTSEGQRISYTYSVIDENTGIVQSENNRESIVVLNITANESVLQSIESITAYVKGKLGG